MPVAGYSILLRMANYKIPQDVEAEDKLVGPLTFKQFIFMLVAAGAGLMAWFMAQVHPFLVVVPLPVILIFGGLAIFRREDQPVERYLLSVFNFLLRPKKRIWVPEGSYEHLVITAAKKAARPGLKQDVEQVHGQLEKLARVVDTRGWATKRPDLTLPSETQSFGGGSDDRLFMPEPPQEPDEVHQREDILDDDNPEARQLDTMLQQQTQQQREQLMQNIRQQVDEQSSATVGTPKQAPQEPAPATQQAPDQSVPQGDNQQPLDSAPQQPQGDAQAQEQPQTEPKPQPPSDILEVSDQISVSQLAAKANRDSDQLQEGEEIKLR